MLASDESTRRVDIDESGEAVLKSRCATITSSFRIEATNSAVEVTVVGRTSRSENVLPMGSEGTAAIGRDADIARELAGLRVAYDNSLAQRLSEPTLVAVVRPAPEADELLERIRRDEREPRPLV
jgi:hypothetical protein